MRYSTLDTAVDALARPSDGKLIHHSAIQADLLTGHGGPPSTNINTAVQGSQVSGQVVKITEARAA